MVLCAHQGYPIPETAVHQNALVLEGGLSFVFHTSDISGQVGQIPKLVSLGLSGQTYP